MTKKEYIKICDDLKRPDANYFGLITKLGARDKRVANLYKQRKERGFDDSETWNLEITIAKFALPRLIRFKELNNGNPPELTPEKWDKYLDLMINAFEYVIDEEKYFDKYDEKSFKKVLRGLRLFGKYFLGLWW